MEKLLLPKECPAVDGVSPANSYGDPTDKGSHPWDPAARAEPLASASSTRDNHSVNSFGSDTAAPGFSDQIERSTINGPTMYPPYIH